MMSFDIFFQRSYNFVSQIDEVVNNLKTIKFIPHDLNIYAKVLVSKSKKNKTKKINQNKYHMVCEKQNRSYSSQTKNGSCNTTSNWKFVSAVCFNAAATATAREHEPENEMKYNE